MASTNILNCIQNKYYKQTSKILSQIAQYPIKKLHVSFLEWAYGEIVEEFL